MNQENTEEKPNKKRKFEEINEKNLKSLSNIELKNLAEETTCTPLNPNHIVWKYYKKINENYVLCLDCNKLLKHIDGESVGNLKKHACFSKKIFEGNQSLKEFVSPMSKKEKEKINKLLVKFIVADERPFRTTETEYFRNFVKSLNEKYQIPCYRTINEIISVEEKNSKVLLKKELMTASKFAITADLWTSISKDHFLCTTVHYLKENKLINRVLSMTNLNIILQKI